MLSAKNQLSLGLCTFCVLQAFIAFPREQTKIVTLARKKEIFGNESVRKNDRNTLTEDRASPIPVVYVYNAASIPPSHYSWATMRLTLFHRNRVVLLTQPTVEAPSDLQGRFEVGNLTDLESDDLNEFRLQYITGMSKEEPWEQFNIERAYYLRNWMRKNGVNVAAYADSDACFLTNVGVLASELPKNVDGVVSLDPNVNWDWSSADWSVWIGSGILSLEVLDDFCNFTIRAYKSPAVRELFAEKFRRKPFVTDMTLWYFYVASADRAFAAKHGVPPNTLPWSPPRNFTHGVPLGIDHNKGHRKAGFAFNSTTRTATLETRPLLSIHFNGVKSEIFQFVDGLGKPET